MNEQVESNHSRPKLSNVVVPLLKGVVYQESDARLWNDLLQLQSQVRDHLAVIGLELVIDEAESYAFVKSLPVDQDDLAAQIPRLVARRQLSFPVSLLLAQLRKKLVESDAEGGEKRLVLTLEEIREMMRVFLPDQVNEARLLDQIETHVNKAIDFGFLRKLKATTRKTGQEYEVRRILKAFIDAQWLSELDQRLADYRTHLEKQAEAADVG